MPRYILRRLLYSLILIVGLLTAVFFLVHLMPGDPVQLIGEHELDEAGRALIRQRMGLDQPLLQQYFRWLGQCFRGDFGTSLSHGRPVTQVLAEALPRTLLLTFSAFIVRWILGIVIGVSIAQHPGRRRSRLLNSLGLVLYSLPSFWIGLVLIMVFSRNFGWFPSGGMVSPDALWLSPGERILDGLHHLVLPVLVLGVGNIGPVVRYGEASLSPILASDWVLAARAHGVPERILIWRHSLRGAMPTLLTLAGLSLPGLFGGAVVVEKIFAWPGVGLLAYQAILTRDYPLIMADTALVAVLVALASLMADLGCHWADPRLRLEAEGEDVR